MSQNDLGAPCCVVSPKQKLVQRVQYLYSFSGFSTTYSTYFLVDILVHCVEAPYSASVWRMSKLTRDGTVAPVSRDHILRRERGWREKLIVSV